MALPLILLSTRGNIGNYKTTTLYKYATFSSKQDLFQAQLQ